MKGIVTVARVRLTYLVDYAAAHRTPKVGVAPELTRDIYKGEGTPRKLATAISEKRHEFQKVNWFPN
jgi:hypothetical protein